MSETPTYPPGHPTARSFGCTCDPRVNQQGEGATRTIGGDVRFVIAARCPMHGEKRKGAA